MKTKVIGIFAVLAVVANILVIIINRELSNSLIFMFCVSTTVAMALITGTITGSIMLVKYLKKS